MNVHEMKIDERTIISDSGQIVDGRANINVSSVYTKLVQLAGRYCKNWASDIIIETNYINKKLSAESIESETLFLGFRESGVGGEHYIENRMESPEIYGPNVYYEIWRLDIEADGENVSLNLGRIAMADDAPGELNFRA